MIHRHITTTDWTLMAIESLLDRGGLEDWREFARALAGNAELARRALRVCQYREPDGSEELVRILLTRFHPELLAGAPPP